MGFAQFRQERIALRRALFSARLLSARQVDYQTSKCLIIQMFDRLLSFTQPSLN